jgi:hypothetical protein
MTTVKELIRQGRKDQIWTKFCGYLDLSLPEYMKIQERLLMEQIALLHKSEIGRKMLGDKPPTTMQEFCQQVPLTTYEDYAPYLDEHHEESLPKGKYMWARTSGRTGNNTFKWVPYTSRMYERLGEASVGAMLMASCSYKGEVNLDIGDVILLGTAPPPYVSGLLSHSVEEQGIFKFVPSLEEGEKMAFGQRMTEGFKQARVLGLDYFYGLASVLAKVGERFEHGQSKVEITPDMLHPKVLYRMIKGVITAKLHKRGILPRDIWKVKGIMTGGTDTEIYRNKIEYYWGKKPLEGYASTEGGTMAMQSWNFKGMTFFPDSDFLEFIPFEDFIKNREDPNFTPRTYRLDEVTPGVYELVFTNLLGGVFTRYRIGDLFEVISLKDDEIGIDIPQVRFYSRTQGLIDVGGIARFTESSIWKAIEATSIPYEDWVARKEDTDGELILHLYIEWKNGDHNQSESVITALRKGMTQTCAEFADMVSMLGDNCLRVTNLPTGSFKCYMDEQVRAGADLAHIKPPHMQPKDAVIRRLLTT